MNNNEFNNSLYNYMESIGAKPRKELLKTTPKRVISYFTSYFLSKLFHYSVQEIELAELNFAKDIFICKTSADNFDFYEILNNKIVACNGNLVNQSLDDFTNEIIFRIKKVATKQDGQSFYKSIVSLIPKFGYFAVPLVLFGLISPLYSNVFNSRLVHTNTNTTFFVITSFFLFFLFFEYGCKKYIKEKSASVVQKNMTFISDYFFDLFKMSRATNIAVKIRNVEQTAMFLWENIPLIYVDAAFMILYAFCVIFLLGYFSAILIAYYIAIFIAMYFVRFSSYTDLMSTLKMSGEKASFLFSFERKKEELFFINTQAASNIFIERYSMDEMNRHALDSQNHAWGELVKMNSFLSMVVMYFACFLAIKDGSMQLSSVIAIMIVNSRLAGSAAGLIGRMYQLKVQKHHFFESSEALFKNVRNIEGINIEHITSIQAVNLSNDILKSKNVSPLNYEFTPGNMYAISGANGIGKTTLLRILSGDDIEYTGEIFFNKILTKTVSAHTLSHNMAIHFPNMDFLKASLKSNFEFYGITNLKEITGILKFAAPKFELDRDKFEVIEADQLHFSNGEKQKLLLAMAIAKQAAVILLDESTSFLTAADAVRTMQWVKHNNQHAIIIFISHDPNIINLADEKIVLAPHVAKSNKVVISV